MLLFRVRSHEGVENLWLTPGGGLEPGETPEAAARREVLEETGLVIPAVGPCVWHRRHRWRRVGGPIDLVERFYVVRCEAFVPRTAVDTPEHRGFLGHRWWGGRDGGRPRPGVRPEAVRRVPARPRPGAPDPPGRGRGLTGAGGEPGSGER